MKQNTPPPLTFNNLSELMQRLQLPAPQHPLVSLVDYGQQRPNLADAGKQFLLSFYKVSFKPSLNGNVKYGPGKYDFREGGLAFLAPNQLVEMPGDDNQYEGYSLYFHPDLITSYPLARTISHYGFFSYAVSEALYLSDKEKQIINSLFEAITAELGNNLDPFSQDVLVSQIELLLHHSNRFYHRQFFTRKPVHHHLIDGMNAYLTERFTLQTALLTGLPSAQEIADHLKVSPRYLSDMLKSLTGKTTQQHIHLRLIEQAKELLVGSSLTTAEIAYKLGFEHPQSFNKLFKQKTSLSPALFRQSIHDQQ